MHQQIFVSGHRWKRGQQLAGDSGSDAMYELALHVAHVTTVFDSGRPRRQARRTNTSTDMPARTAIGWMRSHKMGAWSLRQPPPPLGLMRGMLSAAHTPQFAPYHVQGIGEEPLWLIGAVCSSLSHKMMLESLG